MKLYGHVILVRNPGGKEILHQQKLFTEPPDLQTLKLPYAEAVEYLVADVVEHQSQTEEQTE